MNRSIHSIRCSTWFTALLAGSFSIGHAQEKAEEDAAAGIALAQSAAYAEAFNKNDASGVAALFTEDAEYTIDTGETIVGRAEIMAQSSAFFRDQPEHRLDLVVTSARLLTPDVLVEKGLATVSLPEEIPTTTRYAATHVRREGKWLIADLEETTLPSPDPGVEALAALEWMIGSWKDNAEGIDASSTARWVLNGRFINRNFTIDRGDEDPFSGAELIGYDAPRDQIRSWTFDSEGGFGEAIWRREANKWLVIAKSALPDGSESTAQHVFTLIDDDTFTVESVNRTLAGEALPNTDPVEVVRSESEDDKGAGEGTGR